MSAGHRPTRALVVVVVLASLGAPAQAADVLLDRVVRVDDMLLFPSREDESKYYYAPVQARLARHEETGLPQFSFLRYVQNVESGLGEDDIDQGEGGGIVHAVVQLGVTDEELTAGRAELVRQKPGATIEGPIIFKSGTFALVTSFVEENEEFTRRLVGLGDAPILDGGKAAVSLQLTRLGAKVLWQSFQTATPDISFLFNMEMEGFHSPKEATLEADFEEVYKHESFSGSLEAQAAAQVQAAIPLQPILAAFGVTIPVPIDLGLSADVGGHMQATIDEAFDDLRREGAIRIEYVGEDEELRKIVDQAYQSLRDVVFQPSKAAKTALEARTRPDAKTQTRTVEDPRAKVADAAARKSQAKQAQSGPGQPPQTAARTEKGKASQAQDAAAAPQPPKPGEAKVVQKPPPGADLPDESKQQAGPPIPKDMANQAGLAALQSLAAGGQMPPGLSGMLGGGAMPGMPMAALGGGGAGAAPAGPPREPCSGFPSGAGGGGTISARISLEACVTMRYEFRKLRHRGTYRLDLRKYTASTLRVPFAENIGDMREHLENPAVFRSVNLDDPMYRQREISAALNELGADDFGSLLNSVAVQIRKEHGSGETTYDEVRIDRNTFNRRGNDFKLLYGWKGDDDRDAWMQYQWRSLWSFAGGYEWASGWRPGDFSVISLDPPFEHRTIQLEGSPEYIADADVRSITVRIYYDVGGEERVEQVTLRADRGELSRRIGFVVPADQIEYDYEIAWRLRGNRRVGTERITTTEDILYVDELPEA